VSFATCSTDLPVRSAMISLMRSRIQTMFLAWISMSLAVPRAPPSGWWIMMRAFSVAERVPVPVHSRNAPAEAARPTQRVFTLL
jgi:hypothetical protein